jgi:hypothetical protein
VRIAVLFATLALLLLAGSSEPYSCRQFYEKQRNCGAYGNCDKRSEAYWRRSCLRDGGRV